MGGGPQTVLRHTPPYPHPVGRLVHQQPPPPHKDAEGPPGVVQHPHAVVVERRDVQRRVVFSLKKVGPILTRPEPSVDTCRVYLLILFVLQ